VRQARLNYSVAKQTILGSAAIYCLGLDDDEDDGGEREKERKREREKEREREEREGERERDESCVHVAAACIVQESNHANVFSLGCRARWAARGRGRGGLRSLFLNTISDPEGVSPVPEETGRVLPRREKVRGILQDLL